MEHAAAPCSTSIIAELSPSGAKLAKKHKKKNIFVRVSVWAIAGSASDGSAFLSVLHVRFTWLQRLHTATTARKLAP
jgi:hypothetical protein